MPCHTNLQVTYFCQNMSATDIEASPEKMYTERLVALRSFVNSERATKGLEERLVRMAKLLTDFVDLRVAAVCSGQ